MGAIFEPLIYVLAFVAVVLAVQTLASLFLSSQDQSRKVNRRLTMLNTGMNPEEVYQTLLRRSSPVNLSNARLNDIYERAAVFVGQAGVSMTPIRLGFVAIGIAAGLWLVSLAFMAFGKGPVLGNSLFSLLAACLLSAAGVWVWVNNRRNARLKKIEEQLPLALDIIIRAIRAGHPVISAVQLASVELSDPIGTEFGLIVDETTYGLDFRDALVSFARRTGSSDAHFFAVSIGIQSETGGNLAQILEGLAAVIRGRQTLAKRVRALSSEGRASAAVLTALPILMIGSFFIFLPQFYTSKFSDPIFWPVATVAFVVFLIGQVMIRRIVNIKY